MPPDREALKRVAKRVANGAKNMFKPGDRGSASDTPLPLPVPPPQLTPSHELASALLPQPPPLSQQSATLPRPAPSVSQPGPSTSHSAPGGNQPANVESRLTQAAKKAGADAWTGLRTTLQLLEKSSDIFPTLKSAVAEFLGVISTFETAAQNRNDYAELASNLQDVIREFAASPEEWTSSRMSEALGAMIRGLEKEMEHVQAQQQRSGVSRHIGAGEDLIDVRRCYDRVEALRRELQNKALIDIWRSQQEQNADARLKELNAALKAMYDSSLAGVVGRRSCTPGTREAILAEMRQWADDPEGSKVYWLNGMAGTGKTTLAYSFCEEMQLAGRLGASFFCSRADADSREVSKIVSTIAHQLARLLPSYCEALVRQIGKDKDIGARNTKAQFEKLIRDPLREVRTLVPNGIIVTIDALDECDRRDGAQDMINVLLAHANSLPIKFFVTCRPEPGLFETLQSQGNYRSVLHLHDIEASFVQADIKTYLEAELAETSLPPEKLGMLAEQAGTLFIYAATAVRYVYPQTRQVNFHQRLDDLLSIAPKTVTKQHKGIDELYATVLAAPFADEDLNLQEHNNIRLVLDTAVCAREPMSVATMAKLLELEDEQDVIHALQHLRSVLHISPSTNLISTLHASFPDFMLNRDRSKDLCCDAAQHNQYLAFRCFDIMQRLLRFNICNLESSFVLDENIPDLGKRIGNAISPELFYACRYWGVHLGFAKAANDIYFALQGFLSNRLLFWMEVLNLKGCIGTGAQMLTHAHAWLQKSGGVEEVLELTLDAGRFVTAFDLSSASRSTPHIYISALPFWPETRPVTLQYWKNTRGLMRPKGSGMEGRDTSCLAAWSTGSFVYCVAHSSDGTRIVSGDSDGAINVWDARSGRLVAGPFEGHTNWVSSVAFSHDGTRIVSGSADYHIRVWDAHTGLLVAKPFVAHLGWVISVALSPDGTRIVSGGRDNIIKVWNAQSGKGVARLRGHRDWVNSVAFSPDGTCVVSGSKDNTVRVWDARSGNLVAGPFEGHTSWVNSVAFSPDGMSIVSGSDDCTVRVWDARSGVLVAEPFKGHTSTVNSVAFSSDGTYIVSGSFDKTIRVWDARSGALVAGPFEGHTDSVRSVAFSPDSSRVISGAGDKSIRVWDARSGLFVAGLVKGHTESVNSVAFSHDGSRIISGSSDYTIRVWDAYSALLVAGPFKHANWVFSVAASPDGTCIVSGSDKIVRIWDARSGLLAAEPFIARLLEGHGDWVKSVAFSRDGARIASSSADYTIRVWDAHSGLLIAGPFVGHTGWVNSVAFSSDGAHIVSGSFDKTIRIWEASTGNLAAGPFEGHIHSVKSVAFSPHNTRIVSGSDDHTIRVWNASNGALVAGPFKGHTDSVSSVAFSPNGTHIVSGSKDKTVRVWDASTGDLVAEPFEGHTHSVNSVGFSPDGTRIASSSSDKTIRVWATPSQRAREPGHLKDWKMSETGMINTQQGQLLLCVPADLWNGVIWPQNTACIYAKGVLELDFDNVLLGNEWMNCYQCQ